MRTSEVESWLNEHVDNWGFEVWAGKAVAFDADGRCFAKPALFDAMLLLAQEHGYKPPVQCPLPERGEWNWMKKCVEGVNVATECDWILSVKRCDGFWKFEVVELRNGLTRFCGITRTRKGAMRAAERAARRAWRVRNGAA